MRNLHNIRIIAVDHGYGNVKTANAITPTGIKAYPTKPIFGGDILEYAGTYFLIGEGHKEFIADKSEDEDYYILTLMAVARELSLAGLTRADVHLVVGLPMTWVRVQRESFRAYLMRKTDVQYSYGGKNYRIHFVGCTVYPQGYPALYNRLGEMKGTTMLADIGNGTMNILYLVNGQPSESRSWTEKQGVNQCVIAARNAVMDNFGVKIDDSIIEQVLRTGTADIGKSYLDCITAVARQYVADLFATLRRYEYNPDLMRLYIVGGGGCLVKHFGDYPRDRVTIIGDLCATAKGYESLCFAQLQREGQA